MDTLLKIRSASIKLMETCIQSFKIGIFINVCKKHLLYIPRSNAPVNIYPHPTAAKHNRGRFEGTLSKVLQLIAHTP